MATYRVFVTLKPGLLDSAGRAVGESLRHLGYAEVENVRIGKVIELTLSNGSAEKIDEMCRKLLANPVIEEYRIEAEQ
jgi:phosphoribosylformylglycinamidine synthase PurS subunit